MLLRLPQNFGIRTKTKIIQDLRKELTDLQKLNTDNTDLQSKVNELNGNLIIIINKEKNTWKKEKERSEENVKNLNKKKRQRRNCKVCSSREDGNNFAEGKGGSSEQHYNGKIE